MNPHRATADENVTPDSLLAILREAKGELASAEAAVGNLLDRATALTSSAEGERVQLQRFLEEFALEQTVFDSSSEPATGTGPLIDRDALRRGAQELTDELSKASALRSNIATALQLLRVLRDHFRGDSAFQPIEVTTDVRLLHAMNAAREDERRRLAREIHDGPAQVLANAIFGIEIAEQVSRRTPAQVSEELQGLRTLLKDGVAEIRRFMFDLRPSMLQEQGLAPTLKRYVDDYNRFFAKHVSLQLTDPLPRMTSEQELTIFRIVQEALQNIQKHADTDTASIRLHHQENQLDLRIQDNGVGFEADSVSSRPGSGSGLHGMRERATLIGADLAVESHPPAGTLIHLSLTLRTQTGLLSRSQRMAG